MGDDSGIDLGNLSDADLEALAGQMGGVTADPEKQKALLMQMQMADAMRQGSQTHSAGGEMAGNGKLFLSNAGPLNSIMGGVNQGLALNKMQHGIDQQNSMAGNEQNVRTAYLKALIKQRLARMGGTGTQQPDTSQNGIDPSHLMDDPSTFTGGGGGDYA